jgi:hypothetical protein
MDCGSIGENQFFPYFINIFVAKLPWGCTKQSIVLPHVGARLRTQIDDANGFGNQSWPLVP